MEDTSNHLCTTIVFLLGSILGSVITHSQSFMYGLILITVISMVFYLTQTLYSKLSYKKIK